MDGDALHDLSDEQRAALDVILDGMLHEIEDGGPEGHAAAIARGLDEDGDEPQEPTDPWDEGESK